MVRAGRAMNPAQQQALNVGCNFLTDLNVENDESNIFVCAFNFIADV
jgi:hypothetical protein